MRARDSTRTMAAGSPVGSEPTSGTWATTAISPLAGAQQHPRGRWSDGRAATARRSSSAPSVRVTTAPGEHDGGDRGDREANGGGGGRRCGGIAHVLEGSDLLIES